MGFGVANYIGLFSGGKDSLSTCRYMWEKGKLNEVIYCKTGIGLKENVDYVVDTCKKYKWELNILEPRRGETYEDFVKKFGFPHSGIHAVVMSFLKWHPLRYYAREHRGEGIFFVSGRRRHESKRRMGIAKYELETAEKNMTFYSPILNWTDNDVWKYIKNNGLELCPVYETLHMSGDCLCGAFSDLGESQLIRTFHSYMAQHIESLEKKYGGAWGNQVSMTGTKEQKMMDSYMCAECIFNR